VATLKKFNMQGKHLGEVKVDDAFVNAEANGQMIKDYIVAIRENARQWSANTKGRSEVNHSTQKPHPQKGGGRARQGRLSSPQYKGGGRVFGPKPKFDQHVRINRKERKAAIRFLIGEKMRNNKVHILDSLALDSPKTQVVAQFIENSGIKGRLLVLGDSSNVKVQIGDHAVQCDVSSDQHANFIKSMRNIPKTDFSLAKNINGYQVMVASEIVMTESALQELSQWLC